MGKGDKKTKRGKIIIGSSGVRRPRRKSKDVSTEKAVPSGKALAEETDAKTAAKTAEKKIESAEHADLKAKAAKTKKKNESEETPAE